MMSTQPKTPVPEDILHASCIEVDKKAALVLGKSGSGKSTVAFQALSLGARLVSDDRTCIVRSPRGVLAYAPPPLLGAIEVRSVGLMRAPFGPPCPVALVVDLDQVETARLPDPHSFDLLGQAIPMLHKADMPHFPAAIVHYLRYGPWINQ